MLISRKSTNGSAAPRRDRGVVPAMTPSSKPKEKEKPATTRANVAARVETTPKDRAHLLGATPKQVDKVRATAFKAYEDLSKLSKENLDACAAAGNIIAKGLQTIGGTWMTFTQETVKAGAQVAQGVMTAKTLREAVNVQTAFAKTTFDKLVAEGTKLSEISIKVATEAAEPISARVQATIEKLLKPVAASGSW